MNSAVKLKSTGLLLLTLLCQVLLPGYLFAQNMDSRAGDEAALEALYASTNGSNWNSNDGWSSSGMSLDKSIYGVEVATMDGELRVTQIDLRDNNLTGNIQFPEWGNLKEMTLLNITFNQIDSYIPSELFTNGMKLEYCYLSISNNNLNLIVNHPHEIGHDIINPGKHKNDEQNVWHGDVPSNIDNVPLKWIALAWTDDWSGGGGRPTTVNGIQSIPQSIWNIPTLEAVWFYENWNIAGQGNTFHFPDSISHITNLHWIMLGGGSGGDYGSQQSYVTGTYPSDMDQLTEIYEVHVTNQANLSGFPNVSGSGASVLQLAVKNTAITGEIPVWLVDGTLSSLRQAELAPSNWISTGDSFTLDQGGFSGTVPEFGDMNLYLWTPRYHDLRGPIPQSFWNNDAEKHRKIDWSYTNVTSVGKQDLTNQTGDLNNLRWKYAKIGPEPIPYVDWGNVPLNSVWFEGNYYTFDNLLYVPPNAPNGETTLELYQKHTNNPVTYAPQRPFGNNISYTPASGGSVTLDNYENVVTHTDNVYQWQFDDGSGFSNINDGGDISGANTVSLTISNLDSRNNGEYKLIVTNPGAPDLTLTSEPITIEVSEDGGSSNPPGIPSLNSPSDGATGISTSPVLDWNSSSGADTYRLQVATTSDFSSTVTDVSGLTATEYEVTGLNYSTTYYWRVQASNENGSSDWSGSRQFTSIEEPPSAPLLVSPENGTTSITITPTLDWDTADRADSYRVLVSEDETFSSIVADTAKISSATSIQLDGLDNSMTYWWKVIASNDGGSTESEAWNFTTVEPTLSQPELADPSDGASDQPTTLALSWNTVDGADTYRVQVAADSTFQSPFSDQDGVTATDFTVENLAEGTTYYWRVRAVNANGTSSWSGVWSFGTEGVRGPEAPVQVSPVDQAVNTSLKPGFEWEPVEGVDYYVLHVSRGDPSEMVINVHVSGTTYTPEGLDPETTHHWRVRAVNDGVAGEWSPIWEFTTGLDYDFTLSIAGPEGARMISSPASNTSFDDLFGPLWVEGINGSDAEQGSPTIFFWDEQNQSFEAPSAMTDEMEAGEGYIIWVYEDDDHTAEGIQGGFPKNLGLMGAENSSPVSISVSATDVNGSETIDGEEGWNLIGNPYGVPILVDGILAAAREVNSQVNANVYVWDPHRSGGADYISLSEGEGHVIKPFQVFWIRYVTEMEGTLTLDKNLLSENNSKQLAKSKADQQADPGFIRFRMEQGDSTNDEFSMEFSEKGQIGIDLFDAYKLSLNLDGMENSILQMYSIEGDMGERLSKSFLPAAPAGKLQIPLGFNNSDNGEVTLTWPEFSNIPSDWTIEIEDARESRTMNLRDSDSYTFMSSSGRDDSRFIMHVTAGSVTGGPQQGTNAISLSQNYPNPFRSSTEIDYTVDSEAEVSLTVFNILGKKIATLVEDIQQEQGTYTVQFNASQLSSGIYIYRLVVSDRALINKMTLIK